MNNLDLIVIAITLVSGILALFRGLVREILSMFSWLISIYAGFRLAPNLQPFAKNYIEGDTTSLIAAGVVVFLIVIIVLTLISYAIVRVVRESPVSPIDRSLGFIFGIGRGYLIVAMAFLGFTMVVGTDPKDQPEWVKASKTAPWLQSSAEYLKTFIPADAAKALEEHVGATKKTADDAKAAAEQLEKLSTPVPGSLNETAIKPSTPAGTPAAPIAPSAAPAPAPAAAPTADVQKQAIDAIGALLKEQQGQ